MRLRVLQFQSSLELQKFLSNPIPTTPTSEPGIGDDRTAIIAIYFDSASSMHTVVYQEDLS